MRVVAGSNSSDRRLDIVDGRPFQVLRLETFASPAAGRGAVITKRTSDAAIVSGTGQQSVDLLYCCLRTAQAELQNALHLGWQLGIKQQFLDPLLVEFADRTTLLLQPRSQPRDLINSGDGAFGDLRDFRVDLRCRRLGDLACSLCEGQIDVEAARVDLAAQFPNSLLRGRQGRQSME